MSQVAAIQMCSTTNLDENLNQAALLVEQAADQGAHLIVLPEMFPLFDSPPPLKQNIQEKPGSGKIQDFLASLTLKHQIWLVGGTIPLSCEEKNKVKAASLVFNTQGQQVLRYDKIHLFDVSLSDTETYRESDTTAAGNSLGLVDTPLGRLGVCVCYDLRFPELFLALAAQGAELIAVPAAFTIPTGSAHWELLLRCRAIDSFCYLIGACQGGQHANGRQTFGHSMIVNPWGEVLDELPQDRLGFACAEIDLNVLYSIRKKIPLCRSPWDCIPSVI